MFNPTDHWAEQSESLLNQWLPHSYDPQTEQRVEEAVVLVEEAACCLALPLLPPASTSLARSLVLVIYTPGGASRMASLEGSRAFARLSRVRSHDPSSLMRRCRWSRAAGGIP